MGSDDPSQWIANAADEFNRLGNRRDGAQAVRCLVHGLSMLRDLLWQRVHQDVEKVIGRDSMLMPVSEIKAQQATFHEIEIYQVAESAAVAAANGYAGKEGGWFLDWLVKLRAPQLGTEPQILEQCRSHVARAADNRRLAFVDRLGRVMPDSKRAPLVLFRLHPMAVHIITACAFGDRTTAERLRREQSFILPAITDCRDCRGQVLECVEQCRACGNPLWKHAWLVAVD